MRIVTEDSWDEVIFEPLSEDTLDDVERLVILIIEAYVVHGSIEKIE